jgi:hypothetical protein
MTISSFLIRLIFLIVPGIFSSFLYRGFRGKRAKKDWEDYLEILVFSVFNYVLFEIAFYLIALLTYKILAIFNLALIQESNLPSLNFEALLAFFDDKSIITQSVIIDIIGATLTGFFTAILASYINEYKLVNKIARFLGASKRFGEENVWYFIHRSSKDNWMTVRDHKLGLMYFGWVEKYSDWWNDERELLMKNVKVYDNQTGNFKYEVGRLYVSRKFDDLTIELPDFTETQNNSLEKQEEEKTTENGE